VGALRKAIRKDAGRQAALSPAFVERLLDQYQHHPHWSVKLHVDNLRVQVSGAEAGVFDGGAIHAGPGDAQATPR
jgi:hypothetical protein